MVKKTVWMLLCVMTVSISILLGYVVIDASRTDTEAPAIIMDTPEIELSIHDPESELLRGVSALDNVDGDVTNSVLVESLYGITEDGRATVTYAAFDSAGNVTKAERQVVYSDYQSPRFTLDRALVYELSSIMDVMGAVGAEDILDGDLQQSIKATMLTSGTSVTEEGTHDVQFRVTNSLGDTVHLVLPVEVYPIGTYDAELTLTDYLIYLPSGATFDPEDYLLGFETQIEEIDLQTARPEALQIKVNNTVDMQTPGVYAVTFTASYTDSRTDLHTGYTKLMVVVEG